MIGFIHEDTYPTLNEWAKTLPSAENKFGLDFGLKSIGGVDIRVLNDDMWPEEWDKKCIYPIDPMIIDQMKFDFLKRIVQIDEPDVTDKYKFGWSVYPPPKERETMSNDDTDGG